MYWPLLEPASALEILAQRMVWSLVFVALIIWRTRAWRAVRAVFASRDQLTVLSFAACAITINWATFIWATNNQHVLEASLGYFITPLVSVLLGVLVLHEALGAVQWAAVGIGTVAIIVLTVNLGRLPWIALALALAFGSYGYLKKRAGVGAVESLAVEASLMALPALATLSVLAARGSLAFGHHGAGHAALLASAGIVTTVPLLLFTAATRRLPLSTVGLIQYLEPVLMFAVGVGIRHEPMPAAMWAGFALVWLALVVLSVAGLRASARVRARGAPTGQP